MDDYEQDTMSCVVFEKLKILINLKQFVSWFNQTLGIEIGILHLNNDTSTWHFGDLLIEYNKEFVIYTVLDGYEIIEAIKVVFFSPLEEPYKYILKFHLKKVMIMLEWKFHKMYSFKKVVNILDKECQRRYLFKKEVNILDNERHKRYLFKKVSHKRYLFKKVMIMLLQIILKYLEH